MNTKQIYIGDNIVWMKQIKQGSVDLVYLDPPYNTGRDWGSFDDRFGDDEYELPKEFESLFDFVAYSDANYLKYMIRRLITIRELMKNNASIYMHVDWRMSHYLKIVMDKIFGHDNFQNDIAWCYSGASAAKGYFPRKHDSILYYVMGLEPHTFNIEECRIPYKSLGKGGFKGKGKGMSKDRVDEYLERGKLVEDWWADLLPIYRTGENGVKYPTQKPLALLERIVKASSNRGDLVLDPFCGSGTTLVTAERFGRQWIGMDLGGMEAEKIAGRIRRFGCIGGENGKLEGEIEIYE